MFEDVERERLLKKDICAHIFHLENSKLNCSCKEESVTNYSDAVILCCCGFGMGGGGFVFF